MRFTPSQSSRRTKTPATPQATITVQPIDATVQTLHYVYAVAAALGLGVVEPNNDVVPTVTVEVHGNTLHANHQQWMVPEDRAQFEQWLGATCFPPVHEPTVWAVVQTCTEPFPLLSAAMAYAWSHQGALLIDADATGQLSQRILDGADEEILSPAFDFDAPSPHIYVLNAPVYRAVGMLLKTAQPNPLATALLPQTCRAARQHWKHTIIDCGADLFLAQRLHAQGVKVLHLDDFTRPLYVDFTPHKLVDYFAHRLPRWATRYDFEHVSHSTAGRRNLRRWMLTGGQR